jgi:hypothetical protein
MAMVFSLAACGSAPVTLVNVTSDAGISAKLPSDLTTTDNKTYSNKNTGTNCTFLSEDAASDPISAYTKESLLASYQIKYPDAQITSFDTSKQIDGKQSVIATATMTSSKGTAVTVTLVIFTDETKNYVVTFSYGQADKDGALAKNLQACIDSLAVAAK